LYKAATPAIQSAVVSLGSKQLPTIISSNDSSNVDNLGFDPGLFPTADQAEPFVSEFF
jgi:hypothetical protein